MSKVFKIGERVADKAGTVHERKSGTATVTKRGIVTDITANGDIAVRYDDGTYNITSPDALEREADAIRRMAEHAKGIMSYKAKLAAVRNVMRAVPKNYYAHNLAVEAYSRARNAKSIQGEFGIDSTVSIDKCLDAVIRAIG